MASTSHVCGPCNDNNKVAVVYCNVCETTLCEECKVEHGLVKILKAHRLRDIEELPPIEISDILKSLIACQNHANEEVVYLCKDHDVTCCSKCLIADHRKCNEVRVLTDIKPNLNSECVGLKNILQELNKKAHDLLEHEKKTRISINETEMNAKALLKNIKERLLEAYGNLEKEVFDSIAEKKEKNTIQIDKQTACVQKFRTEVESHTCFVNQIEEFGSNVHVNLMERKLQQEIVVRLQDVAKNLEHDRSKPEFVCIKSDSFETIILELRNALHIHDAVNVENETSSDECTESDRLEKIKETIRNLVTNVHVLKPRVLIGESGLIVLHEQYSIVMDEDGGGIFLNDEGTSYNAKVEFEIKLWSPTEIEMYMPDLNSIECSETTQKQITLRFVEKD